MEVVKSILIVEDDEKDLELTLTALEECQLADDVHVVRDGAMALDFLFKKREYAYRANQRNPAVIFLDLKLPKIDGIEVLRRIKSDPKLRSIPVVMLTSSKEDQDIAKSYELGADAYVVKPVEFSQFLETVKNVGLFWATINEPPPGSIRK